MNVISDLLWMEQGNAKAVSLMGVVENLNIQNLHKRMFGKLKAVDFSVCDLIDLFSTNPVIILERQDVIKDLMANKELTDCFYQLLNQLIDWQEYITERYDRKDLIANLAAYTRVDSAVKSLIDLKDALSQSFEKGRACSGWLRQFKSDLNGFFDDIKLDQFLAVWENKFSDEENFESFDLALNVNDAFEIKEAKLIATHKKHYDKKEADLGYKAIKPDTYLNRTLKNRMVKLCDMVEARDHLIVEGGSANTMIFSEISSKTMKSAEDAYGFDNIKEYMGVYTSTISLLDTCTKDSGYMVRTYLSKLLEVIGPIRKTVEFYIGVVELIKYIKSSGNTFCFPSIAKGKALNVIGLYNPYLIDAKRLSDAIISNDVSMGESGEIAIITGANQGGKTTYLVSIALAQFMFQLGLPVAAETAEISIADSMVLVFASQEQNLHTSGRLGQEIGQLSQALKMVRSENVFFAFNEPLTGTSSKDSLAIMTDVLCAIKAAGARGLLVTHLFAIADQIDRINALIGGSTLKSMIAEVRQTGDGTELLYKITEGAPQHTSYAYDVIKRAGAASFI